MRNRILRLLLLPILISSCAAFGIGGGQVDLVKLADRVEVVRVRIADLVPLADPKTQEKIQALDIAVQKVEAALRTAGAGGPIADVKAAAVAAFSLANSIADEMQASGKDVGNLRLYIATFRLAFDLIYLGQEEEASAELGETIEATG